MIYSADKDTLEWLKTCTIGLISSPDLILSLKEDFIKEQIYDVIVIPMSSNMVLLSCWSVIQMVWLIISMGPHSC